MEDLCGDVNSDGESRRHEEEMNELALEGTVVSVNQKTESEAGTVNPEPTCLKAGTQTHGDRLCRALAAKSRNLDFVF